MGEMEEARALLDSADRGKKQADMELVEARADVNDMSTINSHQNNGHKSKISTRQIAPATVQDPPPSGRLLNMEFCWLRPIQRAHSLRKRCQGIALL